jgi:hypothetical protein
MRRRSRRRELNNIKLPVSNTYTAVIFDCGNTNTGDYLIFAQRTNSPGQAAALPFDGQLQMGTITSAAQGNTYVFGGGANDVVNFTIVGNGGLSPRIRVYDPTGTLISVGYSGGYTTWGAPPCGGGSVVELNNVKLPSTGTYTAVLGDCQNTKTGTYTLSARCFGLCRAAPAGPEGLPRSGVLSHIAAGGSWTTVITLINSSSAPVPVAVALHNDDGSALSVPLMVTSKGATQSLLASSVTATIDPNATLVISTGQLSSPVVGWANVSSSVPISGYAIFRTNSASGPASEGTVPLQSDFRSAILLPYDNSAGFSAGIAIANVSAESANITATVWDDTGNRLGTHVLTLVRNGHTSFVLPNQIPSTAGKRGILRLEGGSATALAGLGLRFSPFGTFTSVPTM